MPISADVRKARAAVAGQSKAVLGDARKPLYAVVGAGDLAASQLRELPAGTQAAVDSRVHQVRTRIGDLRADVWTRLADLRSRASGLPDRAPKPAELRSTLGSYLGRARDLYQDLAERGEQVVTKAAERPGVKHVLARAETLFDRAGDTVEAAADGADETAQPATKPKAPARKTPARNAAPTRPPAPPGNMLARRGSEHRRAARPAGRDSGRPRPEERSETRSRAIQLSCRQDPEGPPDLSPGGPFAVPPRHSTVRLRSAAGRLFPRCPRCDAGRRLAGWTSSRRC